MNVSKLVVGLVVASFSLSSFALTGPRNDEKVEHKKALLAHKMMNKDSKKDKVKKAKAIKHVKDSNDGIRR